MIFSIQPAIAYANFFLRCLCEVHLTVRLRIWSISICRVSQICSTSVCILYILQIPLYDSLSPTNCRKCFKKTMGYVHNLHAHKINCIATLYKIWNSLLLRWIRRNFWQCPCKLFWMCSNSSSSCMQARPLGNWNRVTASLWAWYLWCLHKLIHHG